MGAPDTIESDIDLTAGWGARIRKRRHRAGMNQSQLAGLLNTQNPGLHVDQAKVSLWESGNRRPTDEQRVALARALGTKVATLFPYPDDVR